MVKTKKFCSDRNICIFSRIGQKNFIFDYYPGGPFVVKQENEERYMLAGILHGSFKYCSSDWPTIYTRIDEPSILAFVRKIVFNEDIVSSSKRTVLSFFRKGIKTGKTTTISTTSITTISTTNTMGMYSAFQKYLIFWLFMK